MAAKCNAAHNQVPGMISGIRETYNATGSHALWNAIRSREILEKMKIEP